MSHLTLTQRYEIEYGLEQQKSYSAIGLIIGKDKSVISREIKRNSDPRYNRYHAEQANKRAKIRVKTKRKKKWFTSEIEAYVKKQIKKDFSPEQIVGRAKIEKQNCVSHERIYQLIWEDKKLGGLLYKHLRTKGKRYRKRGNSRDTRGVLSGRVGIEQRPSIVDKKQRIGDLEIDLIIGKKDQEALLTINDRATGLLYMDKVKNKQAIEIENKTIELLKNWKPILQTITSDNGKEFANHKSIAHKLEIDFYFAKPYHSWQRGANENLNGLVRQYFPKGCDLNKVTKEQVIKVESILNNRPRKRYDFKTPLEVYAEKLFNLPKVAFTT